MSDFPSPVNTALIDQYYEAKIDAAKQEAENFKQMARKQASEAAINEHVAEKAIRETNEDLTGNIYHHVFHYMNAIDDESVNRCMRILNMWDRQDPKCDMEIVFSSPGGDLIAGMMLFDYIQIMRRKGHKVTTGCLGVAASMAGILLQAGEHRWMGKEASILIHQGSFSVQGSYGQVVDRQKWVEAYQHRIVEIFAGRAYPDTTLQDKYETLKAEIKTNLEARKDWWLFSDDCDQRHMVDEIR